MLMVLTALYLLGKPYYFVLVLNICFYSVGEGGVDQKDHLDGSEGVNDAEIQVVKDVRQDNAQDSLQQHRIRLVHSVVVMFLYFVYVLAVLHLLLQAGLFHQVLLNQVQAI